MVASGGSSPYEIYIDWGNEDETVISEVERKASTTYTYNSSGEYKVIIKLVDRFGKQNMSKGFFIRINQMNLNIA
ncbi:MAG: hypothetical protein R2883_06310 [Caldisericia bacterium]